MTAAVDDMGQHAEGDRDVSSVVTRRIRTLRKKLDKALRIEAKVLEGKTINAEEQAVVASKGSLEAQVDELEKLRPSLLEAVVAERAAERALAPPPVDPKLAESSAGTLAKLEKVRSPTPTHCAIHRSPRGTYV
jgi:hypothetical protein